MAYRKRIKIMKGLNLNLSGSGISLSAGVRGASVTVGKKGTYLNTGIPGTGLYKRSKILASSNNLGINSGVNTPNEQEDINVSIELDEKGEPLLILRGKNGLQITDESLIRKIKQSDKYKQSVQGLIENKKNSIDEETDKFINIFKHTPQIISEDLIKKELNELKPEIYSIPDYDIQKPQLDSIKQELVIKAKESINNIFFWKNQALRDNFVSDNLEILYNARFKEWEKNREDFISKENINKKNNDNKFFEEYSNLKIELEEIINGTNDFIEGRVETLISEIILPVEFTLDFEYLSEINQLKINLDLPEIKDMPQEKANILSTGKISIKNKSQKELKQEYSQCVTGMAFFLGGTFFNISTKIQEILISASTQRINSINGKNETQYIYSVKFTRNKFSTINFEKIDSLQAFSNFENNMKVLTDFEFKTIEPLQ